jgi:hypothetical protein
MITLKVNEWTRIRKQLKVEYAWKPSIFMIKDVMKRELGFTPRYHRAYSEQTGSSEVVYLDFYDEPSETLFRLKYL